MVSAANTKTDELTAIVNDGRISHAYIFWGPEGIGKNTAAAEFARALVCSSPVGGRGCGKCSDCLKSISASHPDIITIKGEGKSGAVKIDSIRMLKSDIYIRPNDSNRKIYIIDDADTMGAGAQNALLKIFEEPPSYGVIILLADRIEPILPTLRSRAVNIGFIPWSYSEVHEILKAAHPAVPEAEIAAAAAFSGGNPGMALKAVSSEDFKENLLIAEQIAGACCDKSIYDLITMVPKLSGDREKILSVAEMLALLLRDVCLLREDPASEVFTGAAAQRLAQTAPGLTNTAAMAIIKTLCELKRATDVNVTSNLALNFLINCWEAAH